MLKITWLFALYLTSVYAQTALEQLSSEEELISRPDSLVSEKVEKISPTKKIFILSNTNQSFNMGDFISLIFKNKPIARAIVAKIKGSIGGIKILRVYAQTEFDSINPGMEVQIIRGDDSSLFKKEKDLPKEEDLFEKSQISENDLPEEEERKNYVIDGSSLLNFSIGSIEGINLAGQPQRYGELNAQLSWQFTRNFFVSALYGQNTINDFPNFGMDTVLYNITARLKWTAKIFWGLIIQPYAGFQVVLADSPGAGQDSSGNTNQEQLNMESALLDKIEKQNAIFGASILVKIVPGWYVQLDLGTDILNAGISVEI